MSSANKTMRVECNISEHFASYLINADDSGLSDADKAACDDYCERNNLTHFYMPEDTEASLMECEITGQYSNCLEFIAEMELRNETS